MSKLCLIGDVMTCTFFGHYFSPEEIKPKMRGAIVNLIENHNVNRFYVGTHGNFDRMAKEILTELAEKYDIDYRIVLSRVPEKIRDWDTTDYSMTVVPDGIEKTHPRFGIVFRNKWMIKQSDYVITYIKNPFGNGAAQFAALAEKKKLTIIKLGEH